MNQTKNVIVALLMIFAPALCVGGCDPTHEPTIGRVPVVDAGADLSTSQRDPYVCPGIMCPAENGDVPRCSNVQSDPLNCGACGIRCNPNLPDCCNGERVNKRSDGYNCGICGNACDIQAGIYCLDGVCARPMGIN